MFDIYQDASYIHEPCEIKSDLLITKGDLGGKITIAIPTYNRSEKLGKLINKLYGYNLNFSILVVDNSDNLDAYDMLRNLDRINRLPKSFKYYKNQSNVGMFGNWNRCIALAETDYISILNDDDLISLGWCKEVERYILNERLVGVRSRSMSNVYREVSADPVQDVKMKEISLEAFFSGLWTNGVLGTVFHRQSLINLGGFNPNFYPLSDLVLIFQYVKRNGGVLIQNELAMACNIDNEACNPRTIYCQIVKFSIFRKWLIDNKLVRASLFVQLFDRFIFLKMLSNALVSSNEFKARYWDEFSKADKLFAKCVRFVPSRIMLFYWNK